jgi:hypothetical protein
MELVIATITMIITAISLAYFIKSDLKKSRELMLKRELDAESRFSRLEEKTLAINSVLDRVAAELVVLRISLIKGDLR